MTNVSEHVRRNRDLWDAWAQKFAVGGAGAWAQDTPTWGIWSVPESQVHLLPGNLTGKDAIELGCGTAYVSSWLARRGARVVGIDNSAAQLTTARRLQQQYGLDFPLIHGNAEAVPCPDASFDVAISEYGACLWADPQRWVPEAARLLRPGGQLVFLVNSLCCCACQRRAMSQRPIAYCAQALASPAWNGPETIGWSFISHMGIGFECCEMRDLKLKSQTPPAERVA